MTLTFVAVSALLVSSDLDAAVIEDDGRTARVNYVESDLRSSLCTILQEDRHGATSRKAGVFVTVGDVELLLTSAG